MNGESDVGSKDAVSMRRHVRIRVIVWKASGTALVGRVRVIQLSVCFDLGHS